MSDLFERGVTADPLPVPEERAQARRARVRARVTDTVSDNKVVGAAHRIRTTVTEDWREAWLWDASGLTVRALWQSRIPTLDDTAAGHSALRVAWITYNHAALLVLVPLLLIAWILGHPARLLYTAPITALILAIWLF